MNFNISPKSSTFPSSSSRRAAKVAARAGDPDMVTSRKEILTRFVAEVQPQVMEGFSERASKEVVEAMRTTVTNMLGTLPAKYFNVSISAMADNLAQLMLSVLFTGYMFRNAQYRLELRRSMQTPLLGAAAAPAAAAAAAATPPVPPPAAAAAMEVPAAQSDSTAALTLRSLEKNGYAPGVQTSRVAGDVSLWHPDRGLESLPAAEYVRMLEEEVRVLRQQLTNQGGGFGGATPDVNEILDYLKGLEPQNLQQLTASAGEDVVEAMQQFVGRLLGSQDPAHLKGISSETTAAELSQLLFWLLVVGYSLRSMEVRFDMESSLLGPDRSLPPGREFN